jgi:CRP/FNR family transcriptional activator FtrB
VVIWSLAILRKAALQRTVFRHHAILPDSRCASLRQRKERRWQCSLLAISTLDKYQVVVVPSLSYRSTSGVPLRAADIPMVRELDLFADMAEDNFEALMQASYLQRFPPQVELIREGDLADFLHIVVDGNVELFASTSVGRETSIEIVGPVSTFILAAVLRDAVYLMSARTVENCHILMVPAESVRTAFAQDNVFARAVVRELSGRYRAVVKSLKNHKLRGSVERLANYLLAVHERDGSKGAISLGIDKRTLAALLGMTPENLSRAFATLRSHGVQVAGRTIHLRRVDDLRALAQPNPLIDDPMT